MVGVFVIIGVMCIGVLYQDDVLGKEVLVGVECMFKFYKLMIVVIVLYLCNMVLVSVVVDKLFGIDVQVIFFGVMVELVVQFIKQYCVCGGGVQILGLLFIDLGILFKVVGIDVVCGYFFVFVMLNFGKSVNFVICEFN